MSQESKRREALIYHAKPKPGKLEVNPSKPYASQRDLSLAYSPGCCRSLFGDRKRNRQRLQIHE